MDERLRDLVRRALAEDATDRDVTTLATVPEDARAKGVLVARAPCVVAGLDVFAACFTEQDPTLDVRTDRRDGDRAEPGSTIATIEGSARAILTAERTALNFVQRLSGIATLTRAFVDAAGGTAVLDTRKTTPGLRALEKAAVLAGGGVNHRATLADAVLVKDNHIVAAGGITAAVRRARAALPGRPIEVECDDLDQVREALKAGADAILLDNMEPGMLAEAAALAKGRARTEASGGITLANVAAIARTGVDAISVGALTHSAPAADLSLDVEVV